VGDSFGDDLQYAYHASTNWRNQSGWSGFVPAGLPARTAYELSKVSGIPSSKIYETASRLQDKGLIEPVSADRPWPALHRPERRGLHRRPAPGGGAHDDGAGAPSSRSWQWRRGGFYLAARRWRCCLRQGTPAAAGAETSILVSLWPEELRTLAEDLRDAESRGVRIALVH
jgi:hypothetical protein